jgi:hypothetical protein
MAIIGPRDLPVVLKVNSDPLKAYALAQLGFPAVDVEITEQQFELALRVTGSFIAGYFPREQRLAVFYTQPLVPTYPMPEDAYWIQEVAWNPVTTRIDDVFGAESFLFCWVGGTYLLTTKGPKTCEEIYKDPKARLVTPFGPRKPKMHWNAKKQPVQLIKTENDILACTPNHPVHIEGKFRMAITGFPGLHLLDSNDKKVEITDYDRLQTNGTWSISTSSGCFYASGLGKRMCLVH